jgi:manganese efflux pump family protein
MGLIASIIMGLALAMDATAVSLAASTGGYCDNKRAVFRLSFHFGLFQGLMPVIGWLVGGIIEPLIAEFDHWVAAGLLTFVAFNMIMNALNNDEEQKNTDPSKGLTMVMLSVATSIDALAVGMSLKMLDVSIWFPAAIIGIVTAMTCWGAILLGTRIGQWLDKQAQIAGGLVLILIAVNIVVEHTR